MFWIVGLLILAALIGAYSVGWHRRNRGLPLVPFTVGKDGVHRLPLILIALLLASALVACSAEHYPPSAKAPDTTAAAPRDSGEHHEKGKDKDKGKHGDHDKDHGKKP